MNGQKFLELLAQNFSDSQNESSLSCPEIDLKRHSFTNFEKLINIALSCLDDNEIYCEINTDINSSLLNILSTLSDNSSRSVRHSISGLVGGS